MKALFTAVQALFFVFMALFLVGGALIVATQSVGVIAHNGAIVVGVKDWLAPATYTCATLCAVCAFILNYKPKSMREAEDVEA